MEDDKTFTAADIQKAMFDLIIYVGAEHGHEKYIATINDMSFLYARLAFGNGQSPTSEDIKNITKEFKDKLALYITDTIVKILMKSGIGKEDAKA